MPATIHHENIAVRAYFAWEDEGRPYGRHEAHWLAAEATERQTRAKDPALAPAIAVQATESDAPVVQKPIRNPSPARKTATKKAAPAKIAASTAPAETVLAAAALEEAPRSPRASAKRPSSTH